MPEVESPTLPPPRHEIVGDIVDSNVKLDPAKVKQENDHDKEKPEDTTKH